MSARFIFLRNWNGFGGFPFFIELGSVFLDHIRYMTEAHCRQRVVFSGWKSAHIDWNRSIFLNFSWKPRCYFFGTYKRWSIAYKLFILPMDYQRSCVHLKIQLKTLLQRWNYVLNVLIVWIYNSFEVLIPVKLSWYVFLKFADIDQCLRLNSLIGLKKVLGVELLGWRN